MVLSGIACTDLLIIPKQVGAVPGADPGFREGGFLLLGRAKRRNFWVDHAPVYMPRPLINHIPLA